MQAYKPNKAVQRYCKQVAERMPCLTVWVVGPYAAGNAVHPQILDILAVQLVGDSPVTRQERDVLVRLQTSFAIEVDLHIQLIDQALSTVYSAEPVMDVVTGELITNRITEIKKCFSKVQSSTYALLSQRKRARAAQSLRFKQSRQARRELLRRL